MGAAAPGEQPPAPADPGIHRDVLPAVRTAVRDRIADDPGADLELGEEFSGFGVHPLEPAVEGSVKGHIARGHERPAPGRKRLLIFPDLPPSRRVPRHERSEISAGAGEVGTRDRKSTRLNSSHGYISYAVFCLKKKKKRHTSTQHYSIASTYYSRYSCL